MGPEASTWRMAMPQARTATDAVGEREPPDKSHPAVEARAGGAPKPGRRAEMSNLEIVRHYFETAADCLKLPDDLRAVFWTPYREVTVQIPVKQSDGRVHVYAGYRIQHNGARGASASTPRSTSTRFAPSPR
jgi:Glu/Leu/Phe/Val dehydrogenase, dimerisation domain